MKNIIVVLIFSIFFSACIKLDFSKPADVLPPYSEKGANTFGCTVDGRVFVPKSKGLFGSPCLRCIYQFAEGRRYFALGAFDNINDLGVSIMIDSTVLKQDSTYRFSNYFTSANSARYWADSGATYYTKLPNYTGEIAIKHFEPKKYIVSGTFWFDAFDSVSGKVVKIREGRFDVSL